MTAPARITEADFKRATAAATKACAASGKPARIIFRLEPREIEIIVGESARKEQPDLSEWADDDV